MASLISNPRFHLRLVAVWLVLSVAGMAAAVLAWQKLDAQFSQSSAQRQFRHAMEDLFDLVQDAESAERGYALTGQAQYLEPIATAEKRLPAKFDVLVELAGDDKEIFRSLLELRRLVEMKMQAIHRTVAARDAQGEDAARRLIEAGDANDPMAKTRQLMTKFDALMRLKASDRDRATNAQLGRALLLSVLGGIIGVTAAVLAVYLSQVTLKQEKNLRAVAEDLARSERAATQKSTFLANMSHEIRTPMTAILGFSELLVADLPGGARGAHYARSIRESSLSLIQLINDILDVAKMDVGLVALHPEPVDLPDVLDFVATIFSQQMALKSLDFQVTHGPGIPRALMLDRLRVRQILINLVANGLKFTEKGGVGLHAEWEPDYTDRSRGTLAFEVSDTGIGIPAAKQARIFEPFVQLSGPAADREGSGLGLSIVKRLAEVMGGTVALKTSSPEGSIFRVRLPNVPISARLPAAQADVGLRVDFNDLSASDILAVDDTAVNRELLAEVFRTSHHTLRFASSAAEAVARVREKKPDLILMDFRLTVGDGAQAVELIRALPTCENLPVIALTASASRSDDQALGNTFSGFVSKPYTRLALFRELASFIPAYLPSVSIDLDPVATPAPSREEGAERWPHLLQTLHQIETARWPAVRESGAINQTRLFAEDLDQLGRNARCPALVNYAELLRKDAESFSVSSLEQHLNEFPEVILTISRDAGTLA